MHAFSYMQPTPCTIGQVHLLVYYIKLKSHLSVRPSDRHADNSDISAWIYVGLGLCRSFCHHFRSREVLKPV